MKTLFYLALACLIWCAAVPAQETGASPPSTVFEIGTQDGDYREFALAGHYASFPQRFPGEVAYEVGTSDPKQDWPWIHPGPADDWAGNRAHTFHIRFDLPQITPGYYRLVLDLVDTHAALLPSFAMSINGMPVRANLPAGRGGDLSLADPKAGKNYSLQQLLPSSLLHAGRNVITLKNDRGSWALYDGVRLESGVPAPAELVRLEAQGMPGFKRGPWWRTSPARASPRPSPGKPAPPPANRSRSCSSVTTMSPCWCPM